MGGGELVVGVPKQQNKCKKPYVVINTLSLMMVKPHLLWKPVCSVLGAFLFNN